MAFDFPASPTEGQQFTPPGGPTYKFQSPRWLALTAGFNAGNIPFTPVGDIAATDVQTAIAELATEPKGWRNRVINGDFTIDQRNNGGLLGLASGVAGYPADRWIVYPVSSPGTLNAQRVLDATLSEYALQVTVVGADAAIAAGDFYYVSHRIEGHNCRDFAFGVAAAKSIAISFDVKGNAAYTLPLSLHNAANNRSWIGSFAVTTGWTRVTLIVPGDVTGTWAKDNTTGLDLTIGLAVGSSLQGAAGWQASALYTLAGMSNFMAATSNQLNIKNFQIELGSVATEFERVDYSEQLRRCQRYYEETPPGNAATGFTGNVTSGSTYNGWTMYKVTKRADPTVVATHYNAGSFPAAAGTVSGQTHGQIESRVANATGLGFFQSYNKISAEL